MRPDRNVRYEGEVEGLGGCALLVGFVGRTFLSGLLLMGLDEARQECPAYGKGRTSRRVLGFKPRMPRLDETERKTKLWRVPSREAEL